MLQIAEEYFGDYLRYHRGLEKYQLLNKVDKIPLWRQVKTVVLWGPTGAGKTRSAYAFDQTLFKLSPPQSNSLVWWDTYQGQSTLLIDDFYGWIRPHVMLELLDGYPMLNQVKGGHTAAAWTNVIITSNKEPKEWYREWSLNGIPPEMKRRMQEVIYVKGKTLADISRELDRCFKKSEEQSSPDMIDKPEPTVPTEEVGKERLKEVLKVMDPPLQTSKEKEAVIPVGPPKKNGSAILMEKEALKAELKKVRDKEIEEINNWCKDYEQVGKKRRCVLQEGPAEKRTRFQAEYPGLDLEPEKVTEGGINSSQEECDSSWNVDDEYLNHN